MQVDIQMTKKYSPQGAYTGREQWRRHTSTTLYHLTSDMRKRSIEKAWSRKQGKEVPWNNDGEQSNPNTKRTLVHVGPTMGGVLTAGR